MSNNKNIKMIILRNYFMSLQFGGNEIKWHKLQHNGVAFPPDYEPHYVPLIYNGKKITLNSEAEEYATLYAKYIGSEYFKKKIFNKNFWSDWKKILGRDSEIKSLDLCDFTLLQQYLEKTKEEKKLQPKIKNEVDPYEKYKVALLDGKPQPVGNFKVEPPGIFIGRGSNPNLGKIKKRIYAEDITINIGSDAQVPKPPVGHKWKDVVHDQTSVWLASWKDNITGKIKYVWLGASSDIKANSDMAKFDLARDLGKIIDTIRTDYYKNMQSDDLKVAQIATATYFIDKFALRVGNEKSEDEADTVGVTSLRVEHVKLLDNNRIELDFLGKDSVRFNQVLTVDPLVYSNIKKFVRNKNKGDELFNVIKSNDINKNLKNYMNKLSAKTFRTYNASNLFQKELDEVTKKYADYKDSDKNDLLYNAYNKANAKVAILCNHQKNITQSHSGQISKINESIKKAKDKLNEAKANPKIKPERIKKMKLAIKKLKAKKILKEELKNVSLGTSKINYIDPRITVAFLKTNGLNIDKTFTKTLKDKFKWAMDTDKNFKF
jgi:DNA topoisomerase I